MKDRIGKFKGKIVKNCTAVQRDDANSADIEQKNTMINFRVSNLKHDQTVPHIQVKLSVGLWAEIIPWEGVSELSLLIS